MNTKDTVEEVLRVLTFRYPVKPKEIFERTIFINENGCHTFIQNHFSQQPQFQGKFKVYGKYYFPKSIAWYFKNGIYPHLRTIKNSCENDECCNPDHLLLTKNVNKIIMDRKLSKRDGENHWNNKLSKEDVLKIRELVKFECGEKIAKMYNVSRRTVSRIKNNQCWKDL